MTTNELQQPAMVASVGHMGNVGYFKVPVNQGIAPGLSYYASGHIYVEQFPTGGANRIGLGNNRVTWYGMNRTQNTSRHLSLRQPPRAHQRA